MLLTSARVVPAMALPNRRALGCEGQRVVVLDFTSTSGGAATWTVRPCRPSPSARGRRQDLTSTPLGSATGLFAILDMFKYLLKNPLEDGAEHLAADAGSAGGAIGHHALVGGHDGDTETAAHLRQVVLALVARRPGRLTRLISSITGLPSWYFSSTVSSRLPHPRARNRRCSLRPAAPLQIASA